MNQLVKDTNVIDNESNLLEEASEFKNRLLPTFLANQDTQLSFLIDKLKESDYQTLFEYLKEEHPKALITMFKSLRSANIFKDMTLDNIGDVKIATRQGVTELDKNIYILIHLGFIEPLLKSHFLKDYVEETNRFDGNKEIIGFPQKFGDTLTAMISITKDKQQNLVNEIYRQAALIFVELRKFFMDKELEVDKFEEDNRVRNKMLQERNKKARFIPSN